MRAWLALASLLVVMPVVGAESTPTSTSTPGSANDALLRRADSSLRCSTYDDSTPALLAPLAPASLAASFASAAGSPISTPTPTSTSTPGSANDALLRRADSSLRCSTYDDSTPALLAPLAPASLAASFASAAGSPPPAPASTPASTPAPAPAPAPITEVSGSVVSIDLQGHRIAVETAGGRVELGWDRNTLIYQPGGATTASALRPGAVVKAGLDPSRTAYWIQVRPPQPVPALPLPAAQAPPPLPGR